MKNKNNTELSNLVGSTDIKYMKMGNDNKAIAIHNNNVYVRESQYVRYEYVCPAHYYSKTKKE